MIPSQARIANLWCRLMHSEPMWPSHGQYECRACGQRHRVCWDQPEILTPPVLASHLELLAQTTSESG
jgi:hypothetical protein